MKIIITGMHRSGTSMVAGILKLCGLYLGQNLIMGLRDNLRGHFEDRTFVMINDEILKKSGGTWRNPPEKIKTPNGMLFNRMEKFAHSWPEDRLVGWKDPRACLTLHHWHEAVKPEELKIVFVVRPIDQIAASLNRRNKISKSKGRELAYNYMKRAVSNIEIIKVPWILTQYNSYFYDWQRELKHVLEFLNLRTGHEAAIRDFIDPSLWHFKSIGQ